MLGSYSHVAPTIWGIIRGFHWDIVSVLYHDHDMKTGLGHSDCAFKLWAIINSNIDRNRQSAINFDENTATRAKYIELLTEIKKKSRSEFRVRLFLSF